MALASHYTTFVGVHKANLECQGICLMCILIHEKELAGQFTVIIVRSTDDFKDVLTRKILPRLQRKALGDLSPVEPVEILKSNAQA